MSVVFFLILMASQTFTTAGDDTFTWPVGVDEATVEVWGAGGGGGGGGGNDNGNGGGGGGGGYAIGTISRGSNTTESFHVGAAGGGGATDNDDPSSSNNGSDGEQTWFRDSGTLFGNGGSGGQKNNDGAAGGAGGTAGGSAATTADTGSSGDNGPDGDGGGDGGNPGDGETTGGLGPHGGSPAAGTQPGGGGGAGTAGPDGAGGGDGMIIVTWANPRYLNFYQQPTDTTVAESISPAVQVEVLNYSDGSRDTSATDAIDVAIDTNPSGGTLGGTHPVSASSGVSSFSDLSIDTVGSGYTLVASAPLVSAIDSAISSGFNVDAAPNLAAVGYDFCCDRTSLISTNLLQGGGFTREADRSSAVAQALPRPIGRGRPAGRDVAGPPLSVPIMATHDRCVAGDKTAFGVTAYGNAKERSASRDKIGPITSTASASAKDGPHSEDYVPLTITAQIAALGLSDEACRDKLSVVLASPLIQSAHAAERSAGRDESASRAAATFPGGLSERSNARDEGAAHANAIMIGSDRPAERVATIGGARLNTNGLSDAAGRDRGLPMTLAEAFGSSDESSREKTTAVIHVIAVGRSEPSERASGSELSFAGIVTISRTVGRDDAWPLILANTRGLGRSAEESLTTFGAYCIGAALTEERSRDAGKESSTATALASESTTLRDAARFTALAMPPALSEAIGRDYGRLNSTAHEVGRSIAVTPSCGSESTIASAIASSREIGSDWALNVFTFGYDVAGTGPASAIVRTFPTVGGVVGQQAGVASGIMRSTPIVSGNIDGLPVVGGIVRTFDPTAGD